MLERFREIEYAHAAANPLNNAYGILIVTDWDEFATLEDEFDSMAQPVVIDGRRIIEPTAEIAYEGLTW